MSDLLLLVSAAAPALVFLATPFLASAVLALAAALLQRRLQRGRQLSTPAGPWLSATVDRGDLPVRVVVSPEITGSVDGYWPRVGVIGLAPRTWIDRSLAGRMIASHELGHASLWQTHPDLAEVLVRARQLHGAASVLAGSAFLVAALMDSRVAVTIGMAALVLGVIGGVGVIADEATASIRGARLLESEGLRTHATDASMALAAAIYAVPVVLQGIFLANGPAFAASLLASTPLRTTNSDVGLWAILLLTPVLALRAAQVVVDAREPALPATEFRLDWNLFQERSWAFHSSVIVLLWLALTHDEPVSRGTAPLFVLGALPAMSTLGALGRMVVVMPLVTVLALVGFHGPPPTTRSPSFPAPIPARELLEPQPDAWSRAAHWTRIAWLPLALVLVVRAVHGW
jgi:hypothetical protein